jgi:hypothetical protein
MTNRLQAFRILSILSTNHVDFNSLDTSCVVYTTRVLYHDVFIKESGIHLSILKGWFSMICAAPLLALPPTLPNVQFMKLQI